MLTTLILTLTLSPAFGQEEEDHAQPPTESEVEAIEADQAMRTASSGPPTAS